jgi:GT2 family glycosyltransferase
VVTERRQTAYSVTVIIPSFNAASLVQLVLENLRAQTILPAEIIVIDNGSEDETAAVVRANGGSLIPLTANHGFAAAVNEGIEAARSDWLLILNNDVELRPDWLEKVLNAVEESSAYFAVGKLLQKRNPRRLDGTWDLISRAGCAWRCGWNAPDGDLWNSRRRIDMASLTAMLIRKDVFQRIGTLDTRYESYYEDVDFGLRCALAGYAGVYEPEAVGWHIGSATVGLSRSTYLVSKNQVLLAKKFGLARLGLWNVVCGQGLYTLARLPHRTFGAALRGKWNGIKEAGHRPTENVDLEHLTAVLLRSEKQLLDVQRTVGFDLSWKLYSQLAPLPRNTASGLC